MTDINLPNKNVVRSDLTKISFFKFNEETCSRQQLLTNDKNRSYVERINYKTYVDWTFLSPLGEYSVSL